MRAGDTADGPGFSPREAARLSATNLLFVLAAIFALSPPSRARAGERSGEGLEVLYHFADTEGDRIRDRAETGEPIHLKIEKAKEVTRGSGTLEIRGRTVIRSNEPARRLTESVLRTGEITIEAWVQPADERQRGPARIVTLSKNTSERLFTLGQDGGRYDVRFRTDETDRNGMPSLASPDGMAAERPTHVVFTRDRGGMARLFMDGKQVADRRVEGRLTPWRQPLSLGLGNEMNGQRAWKGSLHLVAIYSRSLAAGEVRAHFEAGPEAETEPPSLTERSETLFEEKIAGLLANRCLECHDSATREGDLDLSSREHAFAGKGMIFPGNAADSLLWEVVESDEMPEDREPLTAEEKEWLKQWIETGASWTVARIDPADYLRASGPMELWVRRLTVPEYVETVRAATGVDIASEARERLPADRRADGFSNTAYNLGVDFGHVEAYADMARVVVERMDPAEFARQFGKSRSIEDKPMRALIEEMGKWILRGPLSEDELSIYRGITTTVTANGGGFDEAVTFLVESMLQSPRFLYRIERQRGDGSRLPVSGYEMASRLSYTLWGAPPDRELYRAAEKGELSDRRKIVAQARRMLEDPRAVTQSERFLADWLHLDRLASLSPSPELFPDWNPDLAADMRAETVAFFREVAWEREEPLTALFDAQVTWLTPRLAEHYGLDLPAELVKGRAPDELVQVDLAAKPARGGLLTQGSVLTMGGDEASMVTRGLFVFNDLLRGTVNNPPPDLDTTPVPTRPGLTHRGAAELRISDNNCGTCHGKFEPAAFAFEKYDGLGTWRTSDEHGNPLREDGEILVPGEAEPRPYRTTEELLALLAGHDRVAESLTRKVVQFSLGRPLERADLPLVASVHSEAVANGGTWRELMVSLVTSDLLRLARTTPTD